MSSDQHIKDQQKKQAAADSKYQKLEQQQSNEDLIVQKERLALDKEDLALQKKLATAQNFAELGKIIKDNSEESAKTRSGMDINNSKMNRDKKGRFTGGSHLTEEGEKARVTDLINKLDGKTDEERAIQRESKFALVETQDAIKLISENLEVTGGKIEDSNFKDLLLREKVLQQEVLTGKQYHKPMKEILRDMTPSYKNFTAYMEKLGGTIEGWQKDITMGSIGSDLASGLKGDMMRISGGIGMVVNNIPFLGTISSFVGNLLKKFIAETYVRLKGARAQKRALDTMAKLQKEGNVLDKKKLKADASQREKNARSKLKEGRKKEEGKSLEVDEDSDLTIKEKGLLGIAAFLGVAAVSAGPAGAGLMVAAKGLVAFSAAMTRGAIGIIAGGAALGLGLLAIFGAFALGEKMGAFDGMQSFADLPMLDILASMTGLTALVAVVGMLVSSGVGALVAAAGIATLSVMLLALGASLGRFAKDVKPFAELDTDIIKNNIKNLAGVSAEITKLVSSVPTTFFDRHSPLDGMVDNLIRLQDIKSEKLVKMGPAIESVAKGFGMFSGIKGADIGWWDNLTGNSPIDLLREVGDLPDNFEGKANSVKAVADSFDILKKSLDGFDKDALANFRSGLETLGSIDGLVITPSMNVATMGTVIVPSTSGSTLTESARTIADGRSMQQGGGANINQVLSSTNPVNNITKNIQIVEALNEEKGVSQQL